MPGPSFTPQRQFGRRRIQAPVAGYERGVQVHAQPYRGVEQTVASMRAQAGRHAHNPEVRAFVEGACSRLYAKDYRSEAAAIYYAACRRVRYMRDPSRIELVKDPDVTLRTGQADCDEFAALLAGALSSAGMRGAEPCVVGFSTPYPTHTFVRCPDPQSPGRMMVLDPVAGPLTPRMLRRVSYFRAAGEAP